jgi:hypothetical protein
LKTRGEDFRRVSNALSFSSRHIPDVARPATFFAPRRGRSNFQPASDDLPVEISGTRLHVFQLSTLD